jgi:hypothetical protein
MKTCLSCFLRTLSALKVAILCASVVIVLGGAGYVLYRYGVVSEQARLSAKWEKHADDSWKLRLQRP